MCRYIYIVYIYNYIYIYSIYIYIQYIYIYPPLSKVFTIFPHGLIAPPAPPNLGLRQGPMGIILLGDGHFCQTPMGICGNLWEYLWLILMLY